VGEVVAKVEAVTREDVTQIANQVLDPQRLAYAAVGPLQEEAAP
jgi:predicted Zn-dependent peptidase